ncbi:MAG TPA: DUF3987 domain-containing protein, partial [Anaerolineae bacterium]|nr:DUF3987 domain-containing protein [Anaerolineae bacterium]
MTDTIGPNGPIGWPAPDLSIINSSRREPPPLPIEVFGPWQEWIEQSAKSKSVPVDYVAAGLLACAASLLGNRRWGSPWPGWKEPSALWMMLVGDPSAGKSPAIDCPLNRLHSLEDELALDFPETLRRYERDKEAAELARQTWKTEVKAAADTDVLAPVMPESAEEPERPVRPQLITSDATTEEMVAMLAAHPEGLLCSRDELAGLFGSFNRYGGGG